MAETATPRLWDKLKSAPVIALIVTIAILLAASALATLMVWQNYNAAVAAGEARAESSAHVVAANMEWMMEAGDQALQRIDAALGFDPIRASVDKIFSISQAVGQLPDGFQYAVYDEDGHLAFSSVPAAATMNIADREYFRRLKMGERTAVSRQLEERPNGSPVFALARRIMRSGKFHGVASITIPARKIDDFWTSLSLGASSTVSVVRDDGWVIVRHPELVRTLNISQAPLFKNFLPKQSSGFYYSEVSPADGRSRLVGFRKIGRWPLVATAGIDQDEVLTLFWSSLILQLIFALPMIGLIIISLLWIISLMRAYASRNIELEAALERNRFLFREIHHRVKNNLQAVSSLIRLQPMPPEIHDDISRRIAAMIAVHEHIYQSDQFDRIDVAPYVERLVTEIAASYRQTVDIEIRLVSLDVDRDAALPIGMVVNEVVSNAFKYAFAGRENGHLTVALAPDGNERGRLTIADDGPGLGGGDLKKGMGSRLIAGFVSQIAGEFTLVTDHGTVFSMTFPLNPYASKE